MPNHVGGGWYLLPDGTKVKGKDAALEAEAALASTFGNTDKHGRTLAPVVGAANKPAKKSAPVVES